MSEASRKRAVDTASRRVNAAVRLLTEAGHVLREAGFVQPSRDMGTASMTAATALINSYEMLREAPPTA